MREGSESNLRKLWAMSTDGERYDGATYYDNQRSRLLERAHHYRLPETAVIAAFAALSPNNSEKITYLALDICLGIHNGQYDPHYKVPAYGPNRIKALALLRGGPVLQILKGQKVTSFYFNTLDPNGNHVTVDGHMLGAWMGRRVLLKRFSEIRKAEYSIISDHFRSAANWASLSVPKFQATLWLTWKRVNRILHSPQYQFEWESSPLTSRTSSPLEDGAYKNQSINLPVITDPDVSATIATPQNPEPTEASASESEHTAPSSASY